MTRHNISTFLERQQARTTAELREHLEERDPQRFVKGRYFKTRGGDVVRVNDVTWMSVYGTLWRELKTGWVCYGNRSWSVSGRTYDATPAVPNLDDLTVRIPQPRWLAERAA